MGYNKGVSMRYILNSAVITAPGTYTYRLMNPDEAREWATLGFESAVGYEQTAEALTELLGVPVAVHRIFVDMAAGDEALVFRLKLPHGSPRIEPQDKGRLSDAIIAGHFELGLLYREA